MKKIPKKNYIYLLIIFILTISFAFGFKKLYGSYKNYLLSIPEVRGVINELNTKELLSYYNESTNNIFYFSDSSKLESRDLEKEVSKYIKKKEYQEKTIYINLKDASDEDYEVINKIFKVNIKNMTPCFIYTSEQEVKEVILSKERVLTIEEIKTFFEKTLAKNEK